MMNQDYDDNLGQVKYSVTERENNRIITVPQESNTLIFVMDNGDEFLSRVKSLRCHKTCKILETRARKAVT